MAFQRWNGYVLFRGSVFDTTSQPLPWYYLPYMMLATTPLWILMLCAAGTALALWTGVRRLRARGAPGLVPLLTGLDVGVALFAAGVGTLIFHLCTGGGGGPLPPAAGRRATARV